MKLYRLAPNVDEAAATACMIEVDAVPIPWCKHHNASFVDFGYHVCLGMEMNTSRACALEPQQVYRIGVG